MDTARYSRGKQSVWDKLINKSNFCCLNRVGTSPFGRHNQSKSFLQKKSKGSSSFTSFTLTKPKVVTVFACLANFLIKVKAS